MTVKPLLIELAFAQIEDLRALSPYAMAAMAEYGKVGGYAPAYVELKRDVFGFILLCDRLFPKIARLTPQDLPPLTPNRVMSESFFDEERETLVRALSELALALDDVPAADFAASEARMTREERDALDWLLDRSGIDPNPPRDAHAAPSRGRDVLVSSRIPRRLGEQISDVLLGAGLRPIRQGALARCLGGVFSMVMDPHRGLSARPEAAARAPLALSFQDDLAEIAEAQRRLKRNLMIVAHEDAIPMLPRGLRGAQLFPVKNAVMNATELSRFSTFAARTPWLHPPAPLA